MNVSRKEKAEDSLLPYPNSCDLSMISMLKYNIVFHFTCSRRKMYPLQVITIEYFQYFGSDELINFILGSFWLTDLAFIFISSQIFFHLFLLVATFKKRDMRRNWTSSNDRKTHAQQGNCQQCLYIRVLAMTEIQMVVNRSCQNICH